MVYVFGRPLPDEVMRSTGGVSRFNATCHADGPGIPSEIYSSVMDGLAPEFLQDFMGFGDRRATFVGHGVGLQIDEMPVLAEGFDGRWSQAWWSRGAEEGIPGVGMVIGHLRDGPRSPGITGTNQD
jgi:hypothetical protein